MRGKKAKQLRKAIYGDKTAHPRGRIYKRIARGQFNFRGAVITLVQIINEPLTPRALYQKAKGRPGFIK